MATLPYVIASREIYSFCIVTPDPCWDCENRYTELTSFDHSATFKRLSDSYLGGLGLELYSTLQGYWVIHLYLAVL
jgi:hypothetical protein